MTIEMNGETYYSTEEAATYLGVSRETLNRMSKKGKLKKYKQGFAQTTYYRKAELDNVRALREVEGVKTTDGA